ncbi:MAG: hypothetical protein ACRYG7_43855 [Janthinobacterium lividum]
MQKPDLISYQNLRQLVGLLALTFPVGLVVGAFLLCPAREVELQSSISGYYHTAMRDVFVGTLCVVAFFLFSYRGYGPWDAFAAKAACVFALGVAFFPTGLAAPYPACTIAPGPTGAWVSKVHYGCAALLFTTLAVFSLVLFTKSKGRMTAQKKKRNVIYRGCGVVMCLCMALILLYRVFLEQTWLQAYKPVFWLEATALWAFGVSWLTKGEFLFGDRPGDEEQATTSRPGQPPRGHTVT